MKDNEGSSISFPLGGFAYWFKDEKKNNALHAPPCIVPIMAQGTLNVSDKPLPDFEHTTSVKRAKTNWEALSKDHMHTQNSVGGAPPLHKARIQVMQATSAIVAVPSTRNTNHVAAAQLTVLHNLRFVGLQKGNWYLLEFGLDWRQAYSNPGHLFPK